VVMNGGWKRRSEDGGRGRKGKAHCPILCFFVKIHSSHQKKPQVLYVSMIFLYGSQDILISLCSDPF
jgi:hypothetical protein